MADIDQKIKTILKDLHKAHTESEKFYIKQDIQQKLPTTPSDIYKMALAFDTEEKILLELDLAYSKKFFDCYTDDQIKNIKEEIKRLSFRVRAWTKRQFPCQYKE